MINLRANVWYGAGIMFGLVFLGPAMSNAQISEHVAATLVAETVSPTLTVWTPASRTAHAVTGPIAYDPSENVLIINGSVVLKLLPVSGFAGRYRFPVGAGDAPLRNGNSWCGRASQIQVDELNGSLVLTVYRQPAGGPVAAGAVPEICASYSYVAKVQGSKAGTN